MGIAVPLATAVLIAIAGSCWALAADRRRPRSPCWGSCRSTPPPRACAAAVFTGDTLVELHASTPMEFRTVQTMRAAVLLVAAAVGGFALFASLHLAGAIYGDAGWVGALSPAGGAALMVLVAYAAALSGSTRATTLVVMLVWLFFALIWDPNSSVDAGAAARVAVARAARRRRVRMACPGLARARVEEAGRCAMSSCRCR
ncbi:MAG: hypothetical protein ACLSVD_04510 [Eggerthellaceae bacterium]